MKQNFPGDVRMLDTVTTALTKSHHPVTGLCFANQSVLFFLSLHQLYLIFLADFETSP